ncbi:hypothetical protein ACE7GA_01035 [Roseomonas sp. CCTCC AB2023176]|uniref:hypothetical protein n=1 Tax=Roseomonas sp. CCTCC AB2023176 TaxID=3342640 RepID=UPI0035D724BE
MTSSTLSWLPALVGALIGGGASLAVAAYTQRNQERLQRIAHEIAKRETVYADFLMRASRLLLAAYVRDEGELRLGATEQKIVGLINHMRLFASPAVVEEAERVLQAIIAVSLRPAMAVRELAQTALSHRPDPDPFLHFCRVCRDDLEGVRRTMV